MFARIVRHGLTIIVAGVVVILTLVHEASASKPLPIGSSTTTVSYTTDAGMASYSGIRDFSGVSPSDATILGAAPNIKTFNSVNSFGRRMELANSNPAFSHVIGANESLITHAFFKNNINNDYLPGVTHDSHVTVNIDAMHFDQPVVVDPSTFMFHTLWNGDQVDQLEHPYHHLHNLHTETDPFRDQQDFFDGGLFADVPHMNYSLATVHPTITGNGTDTIGLSLSVPYDMLKNLEDMGHGAPGTLPAPHGFLEPFHFHIEYLVAPIPEPASLALLAVGACLLRRYRR